MIRSETRGVARGAMPKRSRSDRGPPACIISMAQQARPNIMYQSDDLRVQLRRSSTLVVRTISGSELISDIQSSRRAPEPRRLVTLGGHLLQPLEVALRPDVDEADGQDADEHDDLDEREQALPAGDPVLEDGHDGIDEGQLDVEDHEHERDQVEADVEVDPGAAAGRLAALVGGQLPRTRVRGAEEQAEPHHDAAEHEPEQEEHEDVGEIEMHGSQPRDPNRRLAPRANPTGCGNGPRGRRSSTP